MGKKTTILLGIFALFMTSGTTFAFTDVPNDFEYKEAIDYFVDEGFVHGYEDGTMRLDATVTRAEFMKMILELSMDKYGDIGDYKDCFPDVSDEWFAKYVCFAASEDMIDGYSDGKFHHEYGISLAEAAKIIVNILDARMHDLDQEDFTGHWYEYYLVNLRYKGAIPTTIDWIDSKITRGEVMEMMWRVKEIEAGELSHNYIFLFDEPYISLGRGYMRDRDSIYLYGQGHYGSEYFEEKIGLADFDTFERLDSPFDYTYFGKDKDNVYINSEVLVDADPDSFEILSSNARVYSKDKNQVYYYDQAIEGADPATFEHISSIYGKDGKFVYYGAERLEGLDGTTFKILNSKYIKDENGVYYERSRFGNADPVSFEIFDDEIDGYYAKDSGNVYYQGKIVDGIDVDTFAFADDYDDGKLLRQNSKFVKDKDHVYLMGEIIEGLNPDTFEFFGFYVRDADAVYFFSGVEVVLMEGVDLASFTPMVFDTVEVSIPNSQYAIDKNNVYFMGESLEDMELGIKAYLVDKYRVNLGMGALGEGQEDLAEQLLKREDVGLVDFVKNDLGETKSYNIYNVVKRLEKIELEEINEGYSFSFKNGWCVVNSYVVEVRFLEDGVVEEVLEHTVENVPC